MPKFGKWNPKMAEAFGRAVYGKNDKESPVAKMARDVYDRDLRNYRKDDDAAARAEAFRRGGAEAWMDERTLTRDAEGRPDVKLESQDVADARGEARSDEALVKAFEDAFDDVAERHGYERWRKGAGKQQLNDGMNGEIHNLEREGAVDDIRAQMIEDLRNEMDLSDFFDKWK